MLCTGKRCPMQFGFEIKSCTAHDCQYRTKPMTNADRIRAMTDEELVDFMNNFNICDTRENDECKFTFLADCKECVMEWLKQPVTEVTS